MAGDLYPPCANRSTAARPPVTREFSLIFQWLNSFFAMGMHLLTSLEGRGRLAGPRPAASGVPRFGQGLAHKQGRIQVSWVLWGAGRRADGRWLGMMRRVPSFLPETGGNPP